MGNITGDYKEMGDMMEGTHSTAGDGIDLWISEIHCVKLWDFEDTYLMTFNCHLSIIAIRSGDIFTLNLLP
jgi:hypothetical protein